MKSTNRHNRLSALPPLRPHGRFDQATPCKLCGHSCPPFDAVDFNKFCSPANPYGFGLAGVPVTYYRCPWCRFLFTRFFDDWSPEDFRQFVYNDDYVRVDGAYAAGRPKKDADAVAALLEGLPKDLRILDYGSGSGLLARMLGEHGYANVTSYDPFAQPEPPTGDFDLITLFEVVEHVPNPEAILRDVRRLLRPGAAIVFSSGFQPADITTLRGAWWYVAPRNGHCSIFSVESMAILAERHGLSLRGEGGLRALQSWPPSAITAHITRGMPAPMAVRHLAAPGRDAGDGGAQRPRQWYRVEDSAAGAFRWTAVTSLSWQVNDLHTGPVRLRVLLPMVNECAPGYARQCWLSVGGSRLMTVAGDGALQADCEVSGGAVEIVLDGPPLAPPRNKDSRLLGLAVSLA